MPAPTSTPAPLLVRLPNHLGDACMCLPALDLLAANGHDLTIVGKGWAGSLLAAYGWPVVKVGRFGETVQRLRERRTAQPGARGLLFTNSFGTALQCLLAGLPTSGYATEGRGWLLRGAVKVPPAWRGPMHTVEYYYTLAATLTGTHAKPPARLQLRLADAPRAQARATLAAAGLRDERYIVLCPAAIGRHRGQVKAWSGFGQLADDLRARGHRVVACPGPGETPAVQAAVPGTIVLPEVDVGTFAALLEGSALVVANDSGAGHVAAAVDAPLLSVFGVTEPYKTRPWGPRARLVGSERGWPGYAEVLAAAEAALA